MLATINADGSPLSSYTPFAVDQNKTFYIFISTLASHTENLIRTSQASIMLIEDEVDTSLIFARPRVIFSCISEEVMRDTPEWIAATTSYESRFKKFFSLVRGFKDFKMFRLTPTSGSLVVGFGQAYTLHGDTFDELMLQRG
jgi:putative heme iron utilization protein